MNLDWIGISLGLLMLLQLTTIAIWAREAHQKKQAVKALTEALERREAPLLSWNAVHVCECGECALQDNYHLIDFQGIRHTPGHCQPEREYIER